MSTASPPRSAVSDARLTFPRVVRAEQAKLFSLRSTWWTLAITVVLIVGFAVLIAFGVTANYSSASAADKAGLDVLNLSLAGVAFGQLTAAVLAALTISGEFSTGAIRTTFTAVPRRPQVLAAKALLLVLVMFIVGLVACAVAFGLAQVIYSTKDVGLGFGDPGVVRGIIGGGLLLAGAAMFGLALGALLRHTAGAITTVVALLFVLPPLTNLLPGDWGHSINRWFTTNAIGNLFTSIPEHSLPGAWPGYIAFTIEWLVLMLVAGYLLVRRDA